MVKNLPAVQETQVCPWVGKITWKSMATTLVFLPGELYEVRNTVQEMVIKTSPKKEMQKSKMAV